MSALVEAARAALEALDRTETSYGSQQWERESEAQEALRTALAAEQPAEPVAAKRPNVEFSGVPAGHSNNHPAGGTSAGTQG